MPNLPALRPLFDARHLAIDAVETAVQAARGIGEDRDLTMDAKRRRTVEVQDDLDEAITATLDTITATVDRLNTDARTALDTARRIDDAALAARITIMSPLIAKISEQPNRLFEVYAERAGDPVVRQVLREVAENLAYTLDGPKRETFLAHWARVQDAHSHQLPAAERDALTELEDLAELHRWTIGVRHQLHGMAGQATRNPNGVNRYRTHVAAVDGYEHAKGYLSPADRPWHYPGSVTPR